jgi:hypothetical protein
MKLSKIFSAVAGLDLSTAADRADREAALEYVADAWNAAEEDGLMPEALSHASLFAALTALVEQHGEQATADFIATLPDRIRSGDYNLTHSLQ